MNQTKRGQKKLGETRNGNMFVLLRWLFSVT